MLRKVRVFKKVKTNITVKTLTGPVTYTITIKQFVRYQWEDVPKTQHLTDKKA